MRGTPILPFFILLQANLILFAKALVQPKTLFITSISPNKGSLLGGNIINIFCNDLITNFNFFKVSVGSDSCISPFVEDNRISCRIPPISQKSKVNISVFINFKKVICAGTCEYTYEIESTPILQFLVPSAVISSNNLQIKTVLQAKSSPNLQVLLNGSYPIIEKYKSPLPFFTYELKDLPTGFYNIEIKETEVGTTYNRFSSKIMPNNNYSPFDLVIVPQIERFDRNSGPSNGSSILTIFGKGFSDRIENNIVMYEGHGCNIINSSHTTIQCMLTDPPPTKINIPRAGHAGIISKKYRVSNMEQLKMINENSNPYSLSKLASFEIPYDNRIGLPEVLEGLFKPPVTGSYQFMLSAGNPAELYISTAPLNITNLTKIAEITNGSNFRDFFSPLETNQRSPLISLEAEKYYFLRVFHFPRTAEQHLTVGVRVPKNQANYFRPREVICIKIKADGSEPVSGNSSLSIANKIISLGFSLSAQEMEQAFNKQLASGNVFDYPFATRVFRYGKCEEGCEYVIYFDGILEDIPKISVKSNPLRGVSKIEINVLQDAASNYTMLTTIPPEFLRTFELYPQITVRSNSILAVCSGDCKYQIYDPTQLITITNFTLSGLALEITFSGASTKELTDFSQVTFAGSVLTTKSYDKPTQKLTCSIPLNSDNLPQLAAGVHLPIVLIKQAGFPLIVKGLSGLKITQTINVVKVEESSCEFLDFMVEGSGFGLSLEEPETFGTKVEVGGIDCELTYLTNTRLKCRTVSSVTGGPLKISVNNITIEAHFEFEKPTILKRITEDCYLDIIGENFNDDTIVKLVNGPQTVIEKCRSCIRNSTLIRCFTCNLPPGNYKAVATTFSSLSSAFQSEVAFQIAFNITSVEPKFGSQFGGTILTLKGYGFSETLNRNQISIGNKDGNQNVRCNVLEATKTELKCMTDPNIAGLEGPQVVYAMIDLEFIANCVDNCEFTFSEAHTPVIYQASSQVIRPGDNITLNGILFKETVQVNFDDFAAEIVSLASNQMVVRVPEIISKGNIILTATDPTVGNYFVNSSIIFNSMLEIFGVSSVYRTITEFILKF